MKNIEKAFLAIKNRGYHPSIVDGELYIGAFYKDGFEPMDFKVPDEEIDRWVFQYEVNELIQLLRGAN